METPHAERLRFPAARIVFAVHEVDERGGGPLRNVARSAVLFLLTAHDGVDKSRMIIRVLIVSRAAPRMPPPSARASGRRASPAVSKLFSEPSVRRTLQISREQESPRVRDFFMGAPGIEPGTSRV